MAGSSTVTPYTLRRIELEDKPTVSTLLIQDWGAVEVYAVALGGMVDASVLPGWIAEQDGEVAGLLTYLLEGDLIDLVTINAYRSGGIGMALLTTLISEAKALGAARIRVTTTNDNTKALRFYQRNGFAFDALRVGAVAKSRLAKPEIPELGEDGIPIRDELDLILTL